MTTSGTSSRQSVTAKSSRSQTASTAANHKPSRKKPPNIANFKYKPKSTSPGNHQNTRPDFAWKPQQPTSRNNKSHQKKVATDKKPTQKTEPVFNSTNEDINSFVKKTEGGGFFKKMSKNKFLPKNLVLNAVSGIQQTVGWMNPGGLTFFGSALSRALPKSKSLIDALRRIDSRNIGSGQTPMYWNAKELGNGKSLKESAFNISATNKNNKDSRVFYLGIFGGPEAAFPNSVRKIGSQLKRFGAKTKLISGYGGAARKLAATYKRIAKYAKDHPDKAISIVTYAEGHGNSMGGNGRQGSGSGIHNGLPGGGEKGFRQAQKILSRFKNVALWNMISCCHAGAFADKPVV